MPEPLTDAELDELRARLIALRDELDASVHGAADRAATVELDQAAVGRVSRVDALQQQQMADAGRRAAEARLIVIDRALKAWAAGEYGVCRACGDDIGVARLRARPESPLCVPCTRARGG